MIVPSKFNGYNKDGTRNLFLGGGGGGQTTSTVQNTNIPAYAQPYVESMLGATQNQLFNTSPDTTKPILDAEGAPVLDASGKPTYGTSIDSFKGYQAYGGTYDQNKTLPDGTPNPNFGKQLTYDPTKGIAGFTPDQLKTQQGIMGLKVPDQFQTAGQNMESVYNDMKTNAYTAPTNLGYTANNATAATAGASREAVGIGYTASEAAAIKAEAARLGVAPEAIAAQFSGPKDVSSGAPLTAFQMQAAQSNYAPGLSQYSMGAAPTVATKSFTDRGTAESYMSPYMQRVVDAQQQEAQRESDIAGQTQQAQAARSGAFGGSRDSIMRAEAARNLATQKGNIQAQGLQSAFQQAQQQFNAEQGIGLQGQVANQQAGLTVGQQNLGAQLGIQQLGAQTGTQIALANLSNSQQAAVQNQASQLQAQGMTAANALQAALANQQTAFNTSAQNAQLAQQSALANQSMKGQYGLTQGQFDQAANMQTSSQAQNAALANAASKNAASQFGAAAANQASLANQAASNQMAQYNAGLGQQTALSNQAAANQAAQFGAGQNLTSAQTAAQYGLAGNALQLQAAQQQAGLGQQELAAQQGILGMQGTVGAQQQALDQSAKNQAIQDYANTQQYPLMQLGTMSNMLRGLPMQASTTNQYQAAPSAASQAIGTIGSGASIYNAMKPGPGGAAGGLPSEFKYAKGGIASVPSYDMGGEVEEQLESMDEKGLQAQARESSSPSIRRIAQRLLRERQMGNKPQGTGPMGVQYQAAQPQMPSYKPGGIVAFVTGGGANEEGGEEAARDIDKSGKTMEDRLAMPPSSAPSGIMAAAPITQVPAAPPKPLPDIAQEAMRQRDIYTAQANRPTTELLKEIQAEREALGVGDNKAREELRSQQMAERANMKDEQERQRHLRLAEFFASWGSTPGPVLVAGMNALKQSIPGIVSDQKEAKKARREADKIIYDIDEATRLEKLGMIDKATALKQKAASHAEDYNKYLLSLQGQREANEKSLEVARIQAKGQTDSAAMRNASDRSGRLQVEKLKDEDRIFLRYQAATKEYNDVLSDVAKQESQDAHKNDLKNLNTYTMGAVNKKTGEIDVSKISPSYKASYAETLKRVNERKEGWNTAIEDAKKEKNLAFSRVKGLSSDAIEARTGPKATATDSGEATTGSFSTPTAAHIALLKKNPGEKAAFDAKFGPGAANEYLGN